MKPDNDSISAMLTDSLEKTGLEVNFIEVEHCITHGDKSLFACNVYTNEGLKNYTISVEICESE